jgi:hypothetical protein
MTLRASLILLCIGFFGCTHSAVKESAPAVASDANGSYRSFASAEPLFQDVMVKTINKASVFDKKVDVYRVGVLSPNEKVDVAFFLGPIPADSKDFTILLRHTSFKGFVVVFPEDTDGTYAANFLVKEGRFDAFCFNLMTELGTLGWPSVVNSAILIAYESGGNTLNALGMKGFNYLTNVSAVGFFDAKIPDETSGIQKIGASAPTGVKIYLGYQPESASTVTVLIEKLDHSGAVQNAPQELKPDEISASNIISTCLPQFLSALSVDPFISFQCHK